MVGAENRGISRSFCNFAALQVEIQEWTLKEVEDGGGLCVIQ
jgi:hypothetical protein